MIQNAKIYKPPAYSNFKLSIFLILFEKLSLHGLIGMIFND